MHTGPEPLLRQARTTALWLNDRDAAAVGAAAGICEPGDLWSCHRLARDFPFRFIGRRPSSEYSVLTDRPESSATWAAVYLSGSRHGPRAAGSFASVRALMASAAARLPARLPGFVWALSLARSQSSTARLKTIGSPSANSNP